MGHLGVDLGIKALRERVLVIGARRSRQGTGSYVAKAFHDAGCDLCGVVGTSEASARAAKDQLGGCAAHAQAYADVAQALREQRPDIVAICSPYLLHDQHLAHAREAKAHCLCEKPLCWRPGTDSARETASLVDSFLNAGLLLDLLTQWPQTLASYHQLFAGSASEPIEQFEMRLSPISAGPDMVLDAMPHVLSMVWALAGPGEIAAPSARFGDDGRELTVNFDYRASFGVTRVTATFMTCPQQPRPAWYAINGRRAERQIDMTSGYAMTLAAVHGQVPLADPLPMLLRQFVGELRSGAKEFNEPRRRDGRRERLIASVTQLATLHAVARDAAH